MRMGPSETTHQDLASYGGPGAPGLQNMVVLRVQSFFKKGQNDQKLKTKNGA